MKKISLSELRLSSQSSLSREQMKEIKGGLTACGQGYSCNSNQCCSVPVNGSAIGVCQTCPIGPLS